MGIKLNSTGGGSVELVPPTTAATYQITVPAGTGTIVTTGMQSSTINTGFSVNTFIASSNVSSYGTWTPDPSNGNYQFANSNGAFTITTPSNNCAIDVLLWNGTAAGSITFSGYTAPAVSGDSYATTAGYYHMLMIRKINGVSTYAWKALQ